MENHTLSDEEIERLLALASRDAAGNPEATKKLDAMNTTTVIETLCRTFLDERTKPVHPLCEILGRRKNTHRDSRVRRRYGTYIA